MSIGMSFSAETSLMNEKSTTQTDSQGQSIDITAGFMILEGPMASVTTGFSSDISNAVSSALSTTSGNTVTKSTTLNPGLVAGANFNGEFNTCPCIV